MLETDRAQVIADIRGLNEQLEITDPQVVAALRGTYPKQNGLQSRTPGKALFRQFDYPVNGIAVFYNVYGRRYMLWDATDLTIEEFDWDWDFSWSWPWAPDGDDDFEDYQPGAIRLFYAGNFPGSQSVGYLKYTIYAVWDDLEFYLAGPISSGEIDGGDSGIGPSWVSAGVLIDPRMYAMADFENLAEGEAIDIVLGTDGSANNMEWGVVSVIDMTP